MKYTSVNEMETIELAESQILSFKLSDDEKTLQLLVNGAIVKAGNSQNEFYADKYTADMQIDFKDVVVEAVLLEGHKYYDANETLVEQVPDKPLSKPEYKNIFKCFKDCVIFYGGKPNAIASDKEVDGADITGLQCFQMIIDRTVEGEVDKELTTEEESYIVSFYYGKAVAGWDHFQNKVYQ